MQSLFLTDIKDFAQKCSEYFTSGKLQEFFNSICCNKDMKSYYDVFSSHSDGGKRIRAYLVKFGYELCANQADERIILPALSYEIFQTGVLAHDDIIDQSPTRRHKPSMYVELGNGHKGVSRTICQGDFGIIASLDIIAASDFADSIKLKAMRHQSKVFFSTVAGELSDVDLSYEQKHDMQKILDMYYLKTAQYTVSGPLVLGAILANAEKSLCNALQSIGDSIGIAFQIKDDILGIYGEEQTVGKSVLSDMCEGKKTVLSAHFYQNAEKHHIAEFESIYGKSNSGMAQLERVRELFKTSGSFDYAQSLCQSYIDSANKQFALLEASSKNAEIFSQLLQYMTSRNS